MRDVVQIVFQLTILLYTIAFTNAYQIVVNDDFLANNLPSVEINALPCNREKLVILEWSLSNFYEKSDATGRQVYQDPSPEELPIKVILYDYYKGSELTFDTEFKFFNDRQKRLRHDKFDLEMNERGSSHFRHLTEAECRSLHSSTRQKLQNTGLSDTMESNTEGSVFGCSISPNYEPITGGTPVEQAQTMAHKFKFRANQSPATIVYNSEGFNIPADSSLLDTIGTEYRARFLKSGETKLYSYFTRRQHILKRYSIVYLKDCCLNNKLQLKYTNKGFTGEARCQQVEAEQCPSPSINYGENFCRCINNIAVDGHCTNCAVNEKYNKEHDSCTPCNTENNEVLSDDGLSCVQCGANMVAQANGTCTCVAGYERKVDGSCGVSCSSSNAFYDAEANACKCESSKYFNSAHVCVDSCPDANKRIKNSTGWFCIDCAEVYGPGYVNNMKSEDNACVCAASGYQEINDGSCVESANVEFDCVRNQRIYVEYSLLEPTNVYLHSDKNLHFHAGSGRNRHIDVFKVSVTDVESQDWDNFEHLTEDECRDLKNIQRLTDAERNSEVTVKLAKGKTRKYARSTAIKHEPLIDSGGNWDYSQLPKVLKKMYPYNSLPYGCNVIPQIIQEESDKTLNKAPTSAVRANYDYLAPPYRQDGEFPHYYIFKKENMSDAEKNKLETGNAKDPKYNKWRFQVRKMKDCFNGDGEIVSHTTTKRYNQLNDFTKVKTSSVTCPFNSVANNDGACHCASQPVGGKCPRCDNSEIYINGVCKKCGDNQVPSTNKKTCLDCGQGEASQKGKCLCNDNYGTLIGEQTCSHCTSTVGYVYGGNGTSRCECDVDNGYGSNGETCVVCSETPGYEVNNETQMCECTVDGYAMHNGECTLCNDVISGMEPNEDHSQCICPDNKIFFNHNGVEVCTNCEDLGPQWAVEEGTCVDCTVTRGPNFARHNSRCKCKGNNLGLWNDECITCTTLGTGMTSSPSDLETIDGAHCGCYEENYAYHNGVCRVCSDVGEGFLPYQPTQQCLCIQETNNKLYGMLGNSCIECSGELHKNTEDGIHNECSCSPGKHLVNNACTDCQGYGKGMWNGKCITCADNSRFLGPITVTRPDGTTFKECKCILAGKQFDRIDYETENNAQPCSCTTVTRSFRTVERYCSERGFGGVCKGIQHGKLTSIVSMESDTASNNIAVGTENGVIRFFEDQIPVNLEYHKNTYGAGHHRDHSSTESTSITDLDRVTRGSTVYLASVVGQSLKIFTGTHADVCYKEVKKNGNYTFTSVSFSPNGLKVAAAYGPNVTEYDIVNLASCSNNPSEPHFKTDHQLSDNCVVNGFTYLGDNDMFIVGTEINGDNSCWNRIGGSSSDNIANMYYDKVIASPDNLHVLVSTRTKQIRVLDLSGTHVKTINTLNLPVTDMEFSPDGTKLAVAVSDGSNSKVLLYSHASGDYDLLRMLGDLTTDYWRYEFEDGLDVIQNVHFVEEQILALQSEEQIYFYEVSGTDLRPLRYPNGKRQCVCETGTETEGRGSHYKQCFEGDYLQQYATGNIIEENATSVTKAKFHLTIGNSGKLQLREINRNSVYRKINNTHLTMRNYKKGLDQIKNKDNRFPNDAEEDLPNRILGVREEYLDLPYVTVNRPNYFKKVIHGTFENVGMTDDFKEDFTTNVKRTYSTQREFDVKYREKNAAGNPWETGAQIEDLMLNNYDLELNGDEYTITKEKIGEETFVTVKTVTNKNYRFKLLTDQEQCENLATGNFDEKLNVGFHHTCNTEYSEEEKAIYDVYGLNSALQRTKLYNKADRFGYQHKMLCEDPSYDHEEMFDKIYMYNIYINNTGTSLEPYLIWNNEEKLGKINEAKNVLKYDVLRSDSKQVRVPNTDNPIQYEKVYVDKTMDREKFKQTTSDKTRYHEGCVLEFDSFRKVNRYWTMADVQMKHVDNSGKYYCSLDPSLENQLCHEFAESEFPKQEGQAFCAHENFGRDISRNDHEEPPYLIKDPDVCSIQLYESEVSRCQKITSGGTFTSKYGWAGEQGKFHRRDLCEEISNPKVSYNTFRERKNSDGELADDQRLYYSHVVQPVTSYCDGIGAAAKFVSEITIFKLENGICRNIGCPQNLVQIDNNCYCPAGHEMTEDGMCDCQGRNDGYSHNSEGKCIKCSTLGENYAELFKSWDTNDVQMEEYRCAICTDYPGHVKRKDRCVCEADGYGVIGIDSPVCTSCMEHNGTIGDATTIIQGVQTCACNAEGYAFHKGNCVRCSDLGEGDDDLFEARNGRCASCNKQMWLKPAPTNPGKMIMNSGWSSGSLRFVEYYYDSKKDDPDFKGDKRIQVKIKDGKRTRATIMANVNYNDNSWEPFEHLEKKYCADNYYGHAYNVHGYRGYELYSEASITHDPALQQIFAPLSIQNWEHCKWDPPPLIRNPAVNVMNRDDYPYGCVLIYREIRPRSQRFNVDPKTGRKWKAEPNYKGLVYVWNNHKGTKNLVHGKKYWLLGKIDECCTKHEKGFDLVPYFTGWSLKTTKDKYKRTIYTCQFDKCDHYDKLKQFNIQTTNFAQIWERTGPRTVSFKGYKTYSYTSDRECICKDDEITKKPMRKTDIFTCSQCPSDALYTNANNGTCKCINQYKGYLNNKCDFCNRFAVGQERDDEGQCKCTGEGYGYIVITNPVKVYHIVDIDINLLSIDLGQGSWSPKLRELGDKRNAFRHPQYGLLILGKYAMTDEIMHFPLFDKSPSTVKVCRPIHRATISNSRRLSGEVCSETSEIQNDGNKRIVCGSGCGTFFGSDSCQFCSSLNAVRTTLLDEKNNSYEACVCNEEGGFGYKDGECAQCSDTPGYRVSDGQCECLANNYIETATGGCDRCPDNEQRDELGTACQCVDGFGSGTLQTLSSSAKSSCYNCTQLSPGLRSVDVLYDNNAVRKRCVCLADGYGGIEGESKCEVCSSVNPGYVSVKVRGDGDTISFDEGNECRCRADGFGYFNHRCIQCTGGLQQTGSDDNGDNVCACTAEGYELVDGLCVEIEHRPCDRVHDGLAGLKHFYLTSLDTGATIYNEMQVLGKRQGSSETKETETIRLNSHNDTGVNGYLFLTKDECRQLDKNRQNVRNPAALQVRKVNNKFTGCYCGNTLCDGRPIWYESSIKNEPGFTKMIDDNFRANIQFADTAMPVKVYLCCDADKDTYVSYKTGTYSDFARSISHQGYRYPLCKTAVEEDCGFMNSVEYDSANSRCKCSEPGFRFDKHGICRASQCFEEGFGPHPDLDKDGECVRCSDLLNMKEVDNQCVCKDTEDFTRKYFQFNKRCIPVSHLRKSFSDHQNCKIAGKTGTIDEIGSHPYNTGLIPKRLGNSDEWECTVNDVLPLGARTDDDGVVCDERNTWKVHDGECIQYGCEKRAHDPNDVSKCIDKEECTDVAKYTGFTKKIDSVAGYMTGHMCKCDDNGHGYMEEDNTGTCYLCSDTPGYVLNTSGFCICKDEGFGMVDGVCTRCDADPNPGIISYGGTCACRHPDYYTNPSGQCTSCKVFGETYGANEAHDGCVDCQGENYYFESSLNSCVDCSLLGTGYAANDAHTACGCFKLGYGKFNGQCTQCSSVGRESVDGLCVCGFGQMENENGDCQTCNTFGAGYIATDSGCKCAVTGYAMHGGECVHCNTALGRRGTKIGGEIGGKCQYCDNYDASTGRCICSSGQDFVLPPHSKVLSYSRRSRYSGVLIPQTFSGQCYGCESLGLVSRNGKCECESANEVRVFRQYDRRSSCKCGSNMVLGQAIGRVDGVCQNCKDHLGLGWMGKGEHGCYCAESGYGLFKPRVSLGWNIRVKSWTEPLCVQCSALGPGYQSHTQFYAQGRSRSYRHYNDYGRFCLCTAPGYGMRNGDCVQCGAGVRILLTPQIKGYNPLDGNICGDIRKPGMIVGNYILREERGLGLQRRRLVSNDPLLLEECPVGTTANNDHTVCECKADGFAIHNGVCTQCSTLSDSERTFEVINDGKAQICGCKSNGYGIFGDSNCHRCADSDRVLDGIDCECPVGTDEDVYGTCRACNTYVNEQGFSLLKNASKSGCACKTELPGVIKVGHALEDCQMCVGNGLVPNEDKNECVCGAENYYLNDEAECVACKTLGEGYVRSLNDDVCTCSADGFALDADGECVRCSTFGEGFQPNDDHSECVCTMNNYAMHTFDIAVGSPPVDSLCTKCDVQGVYFSNGDYREANDDHSRCICKNENGLIGESVEFYHENHDTTSICQQCNTLAPNGTQHLPRIFSSDRYVLGDGYVSSWKLENDKCVCADNHIFYDGECRPCSTVPGFDADCTCDAGYALSADNKCTSCISSHGEGFLSTSDDSDCVCSDPAFGVHNEKCIKCSNLGDGYVGKSTGVDSNNTCVCEADGYAFHEDVCTLCSEVAEGFIATDGKCKCSLNTHTFVEKTKECEYCDPLLGFEIREGVCQCKSTDSAGSEILSDIASDSCYCPGDRNYLNTDTGNCVECPQTQIGRNNQCECENDAYAFNEEFGMCMCPEGKVKSLESVTAFEDGKTSCEDYGLISLTEEECRQYFSDTSVMDAINPVHNVSLTGCIQSSNYDELFFNTGIVDYAPLANSSKHILLCGTSECEVLINVEDDYQIMESELDRIVASDDAGGAGSKITLEFGNNGMSDYVYESQNDPDIVLSLNQQYEFKRTTAGHTLRLVKDSDCTGCDTGTYSSLPTSSVTGWTDVSYGTPVDFTFTEAGTYYYVCVLHPSMVGKITVS